MFTRKLEYALEALAREVARQNGQEAIDNAGDGETILLLNENPSLNLRELADALLAHLEIEVQWE